MLGRGSLAWGQPAEPGLAQGGLPGIPALQLNTGADGSQQYTVSLQILAVMTALTLLPAFLMMMTAFTRIIIVLAILRQAIGLQTTPSNQILLGIALFLTVFVMLPVKIGRASCRERG